MSGAGLLSSLAGIVLLAAVAEIVSRCVPRRPALGHALWLLVLVRSLIPSIPLISVRGILESVAVVPLLAPIAATPASALADRGPWILGGFETLILLWAAGVVWFVARALLCSRRMRRCIRFAHRVDASLEIEVERLARGLGVRAPRVMSLPGARSPFLYGLRDPVLIWPKVGGPASDEARSAMILHELAHLKRRDPWTSWIEVAAPCLWWWNPLIWYAVAQSRRYKELACDASVMDERPEYRHVYASALIDAVRVKALRALPAESLGLIGSAARVRERLQSLYAVQRTARISATALVAVLALFALSLPGLTRPSFAPAKLPSTSTRSLPSATSVAVTSVAVTESPADAPRVLSDVERSILQRAGVSSFEELQGVAEAAIADNPRNGWAHSRLGWSFVARGDFVNAIPAFERQYELGYTTTYASYNAACCYARLGAVDDAIYWLEKSVKSGSNDPLAIEQDPDLDILRDDPRYRALIDELVAQAARR